MNKFLFILVFKLMISFQSMAQIEKGNFMIGGTMNFKYTNQNDVINYSYSVDPQLSYFFIKHLSTGLIVPTSFGGVSGQGVTKSGYENHAVGAAIRYYFPIGNKWAIFPAFSYSHNWYSDNGYILANLRVADPGDPLLNTSSHVTMTSTLLVAGVGGTYFISKNLGLEGILSYQKEQTGRSPLFTDNDSKSINFKIGLQIYLIAKKNRLYNVE